MKPRHKPLPSRRAPVKRTGKPKATNVVRRQREFARAYHSKERVEFVQSLPCIVCQVPPSENAHVGHLDAGAGRRARFDQIAPLCRQHHAHLHAYGPLHFAELGVSLAMAAEATEAAWQARGHSPEGDA